MDDVRKALEKVKRLPAVLSEIQVHDYRQFIAWLDGAGAEHSEKCERARALLAEWNAGKGSE